jgi:hypothetical protein
VRDFGLYPPTIVVAAPVAANRAQPDNGRTQRQYFATEIWLWATQWRPAAAGGHGSRHYDGWRRGAGCALVISAIRLLRAEVDAAIAASVASIQATSAPS